MSISFRTTFTKSEAVMRGLTSTAIVGSTRKTAPHSVEIVLEVDIRVEQTVAERVQWQLVHDEVLKGLRIQKAQSKITQGKGMS